MPHPSDTYGSDGDLQTATTKVWDGSNWQETGTTLYRYYTDLASTSSGAPGLPQPVFPLHLLKYAVLPDAFERLADDPGVTDPLTASNAIVAQYADFYFEYDGDRRVVREQVDGGSRQFDFAYSVSSHGDGYNSWKTKTVESRSDGTQRTVYSNFAGQTMLSVLRSGSDQWIEFFKYDEAAQLILQASPSAVTGFDDQFPDLLDEDNGQYQYLRDSAGLIRRFSYHSPSGYLASASLQEGQLGSVVKLREVDYVACPNDASVFFPSEETDYPSATDPNAQIVTSYSYTFHSGTCQIQQRTTTLPAVPTSQNGSGSSDSRKEVFDVYGNRTWTMDERGFISRREFDPVTGAVVRQVEDVDTSLETGVPSGWTTPSGGGLNLVTDIENDDQGRPVQRLGPTHTVDLAGTSTPIRRAEWTVYDDPNRQIRSARGYATGTQWDQYTLVNPVSISLSNHRNQLLESIEATRTSTSGRLLPTDTFSQSSYVRWSTWQYTDCCLLSSMRIYHTIPVSGEGSSGTNYDETTYGYDSLKRRNRQVSPGGTITRTTYNIRGNVTGTFVGTDDTGATAADPTGGGALGNNMVQVSALEYDNGNDQGDNNLSHVVEYAYNRAGDLLVETDAKSQDTTHTYDALGRRISTTDRLNNTTTFAWTVLGLQESITDAESDTTTYVYDDYARLYQTIWPDHVSGTVPGDQGYGITQSEYDSLNRVLRTTDQLGDTVTHDYDDAGRLLSRDYRTEANSPAGPIADSDTFTYDDASRMLTAASGRYSNTATFTYDSAGRKSTESLTISGQTYTSTTQYDAAGRVSKLTYPDGSEVTRGYTARGQLETIAVGTTTIDTRGYDDGGRMTSSVYNNGVGESRSYNSDNTLASISFSGAAIGDLTYTWDANQNKTAESITGVMSGYGFSVGASGYDAEDRLVNWDRSDANLDQSWDLSPVGDWNSITENSSVQNRTHGPTHEILTAASQVVQHDPKGNMTLIPAVLRSGTDPMTMKWDFDNKLRAADTNNDGTDDLFYKWDALGRRVGHDDGTDDVVYSQDGQQTLADYPAGTAATSPTYTYIYGSYIDEPVLRTDSSGTKLYYHRNQQTRKGDGGSLMGGRGVPFGFGSSARSRGKRGRG